MFSLIFNYSDDTTSTNLKNTFEGDSDKTYKYITSVINEIDDGDEEREKRKENANLTKMNHQMWQSFSSNLLGKKT
jgi:hypothetical protein